VTLGLYFLAAMVLYGPLVIACCWLPGLLPGLREQLRGAWTDSFEIWTDSFAIWWFWLILGVFLLAQALLLVVPVRAVWDYQIKPRRMFVPIATTCTLLAILVAGILISVMIAISSRGYLVALYGCLFLAGLSWLVWWKVFRKYARASADHVVDVTGSALLRGSIVELLVAIGCHIWVRQRGDCSSPIVTFIAICAGFATMLCAFGPGVFYLLIARARQMRSKRSRLSS
jgi:hypothetical protein